MDNLNLERRIEELDSRLREIERSQDANEARLRNLEDQAHVHYDEVE